MSDVRKTEVKLEISTDAGTLERIKEHVLTFRNVPGVEAVEVEVSPHWLRFHLQMTLAGTSSKDLQRLYNKVSKMASQPPFTLSSRTCSLSELFAD